MGKWPKFSNIMWGHCCWKYFLLDQPYSMAAAQSSPSMLFQQGQSTEKILVKVITLAPSWQLPYLMLSLEFNTFSFLQFAYPC